MKPYSPQPGTIPHRVIEHLKTLPPGTELASAVLAEIIGQETRQMAACLVYPRKHGVLVMRQHEDGNHVWSLGNGMPTPPPEDNEPDEPLHPVPKMPKKPASPFDLRKPRTLVARDAARTRGKDPQPVQAQAAAPVTHTEPDTNRAKYGIYSDGTFCVQRGVDAIWLTPSETEELGRFLQFRV